MADSKRNKFAKAQDFREKNCEYMLVFNRKIPIYLSFDDLPKKIFDWMIDFWKEK